MARMEKELLKAKGLIEEAIKNAETQMEIIEIMNLTMNLRIKANNKMQTL